MVGQVEATATAFAGVYGNNLRTTGGVGLSGIGYQGVSGQNAHTDAGAVVGTNTSAASGNNTGGANFRAPGVIGTGFYGVLGQCATDGGGGVYGLNTNTVINTGNDNEGVHGYGNFVGVEGEAHYSGGGYGIASLDSIYALGNISCNGFKAFTIDHPLDPANKYLKHFCPESNEVLNFYRGNLKLDANGEGTVTLPDYFEAINGTDYSYILTAVGGAAPNLHVSREMDGKTFAVAGGTPGLKVSWQLTASRDDAYVKEHVGSNQAEQPKEARNIGRYLDPAAYGQPATQGVFNKRGPNKAELTTVKGEVGAAQKALPLAPVAK